MTDHKEIFDEIAGDLQNTVFADGYQKLNEAFADQSTFREMEEALFDGLSANHTSRVPKPH